MKLTAGSLTLIAGGLLTVDQSTTALSPVVYMKEQLAVSRSAHGRHCMIRQTSDARLCQIQRHQVTGLEDSSNKVLNVATAKSLREAEYIGEANQQGVSARKDTSSDASIDAGCRQHAAQKC